MNPFITYFAVITLSVLTTIVVALYYKETQND
jgi:hypothetical protein